MAYTITKTINIKTNPDKAWDYINDLSKWPEWAIHNIISSKQDANGYWLMEGPRGTSKVKMRYSDKPTGILDHDFIDPGEGRWTVFSRVIPGNEGTHYMITFTKPGQMSDEAFEEGMQLFDEELLKLKDVLET